MPDSDSASVSVLARASYPDSFALALALRWPDLEPDSDLDSEPEEEKRESSKEKGERGGWLLVRRAMHTAGHSLQKRKHSHNDRR